VAGRRDFESGEANRRRIRLGKPEIRDGRCPGVNRRGSGPTRGFGAPPASEQRYPRAPPTRHAKTGEIALFIIHNEKAESVSLSLGHFANSQEKIVSAGPYENRRQKTRGLPSSQPSGQKRTIQSEQIQFMYSLSDEWWLGLRRAASRQTDR